MSLHFHPLRVRSVLADTDEAVIVSFDVPDDVAGEFRFTHGQHLTVRQQLQGVEHRRSYSICTGTAEYTSSSRSARASAANCATGFSQNTGTPRATADRMRSLWVGVELAMTTPSTPKAKSSS